MPLIEPQHVLIFRPDANEAQVQALIEDALGVASTIPGFRRDETNPTRVARALPILRWAVIRRLDAGSGAATSVTETAGPYTTTQTFGSSSLRLLTEGDLAELRRIWSVPSGAFMVNTAPRARSR